MDYYLQQEYDNSKESDSAKTLYHHQHDQFDQFE